MPYLTDFSKFPSTCLPPLGQALIIRDLRGTPPLRGAGLMSIRRAVAAGTHDKHPIAETHKAERKRLRALRVADMPPDPQDMWLMIEALSQKLHQAGQAQAWESIGIKGNRGRELLVRSCQSVDWPIWFTLRHAVFGS